MIWKGGFCESDVACDSGRHQERCLFFVSVLSLPGTGNQLGFHTCQLVKRLPAELSPAPLLFVYIEIWYYWIAQAAGLAAVPPQPLEQLRLQTWTSRSGVALADCRIIFSRRETMTKGCLQLRKGLHTYRPVYFSREGFIEGLEMIERPTSGGRAWGADQRVTNWWSTWGLRAVPGLEKERKAHTRAMICGLERLHFLLQLPNFVETIVNFRAAFFTFCVTTN